MFTAKKTPAERIPVGLWAQFRRQSPGYVVGVVFLGAYQYLQYRFDNLLDTAVDRAVNEPGSEIYRLGAVMVAIAVVSFGGRVMSRVAIFNGGRNAEYELRRALLHHLHKLGPAFYSRMPTGEIMSRVTNDLTQVRLLLGFGVLNFVSTSFSLVSALAVTLERSVKLTFASLVAMPLLLIVVSIFSKKMYELQRQNQDAMGKLSESVQSSIAGVRIVRAFGLEASEKQHFEVVNQLYLDRSLRLARLRGVMWPVMQAISSIGVVVLLWYGGHLVLTDPTFDEGSFVAFFRALSRLTWPLISLGFLISVIQRGRASYSRVHELFQVQPEVRDGKRKLEPGPLHLSVRGLTFSYGNHRVLEDVSFDLGPGQSIAIVGRTGSGKSTLALLLVRLQSTPRGAVFLNNIDVCDLPLAQLRKTIGYAQQDAFLFSTTVGRNLGYALPDPDSSAGEASIRAAAAEAQIRDEIELLPDAFDTVVGERGVQLSGGQKQRVSLGRALVSEPSILILDDPLSAVDGRTEQAILAAIDRQRAKRSVILITHRVSAAERCDRVIVLDGGRVVEAGTPDELRRSGGLFAAFAEEQRIENELKRLGASDASETSRRPQAVTAED